MSSIVKSFSFPKGEIRGDTYYIKHAANTFTLIDCFLKSNSEYPENNRKEEIINEIVSESEGRICRFISTHPDNDHIAGIEELDKNWKITNFYAVENDIPSNDDDLSLTKYIDLKDKYNFPLKKGIKRCWLNESNDENKSSGINFYWPIINNDDFQEALKKVKNGENINDICPIFTYKFKGGATYMWMGDLETEMQQSYYNACKHEIPKINILFQPHHGRFSASVPSDLLNALNPQLIIIGNAPSKHIDYGDSKMTITQNTSGDLTFINENGYVHIYSQNNVENLPSCLECIDELILQNLSEDNYYCGSLKV